MSDAPITPDVKIVPRVAATSGTVNLVGKTRAELGDLLMGAGVPAAQAKMRVGQIWQWIYNKGVRDFEQMTNLSKQFRADLAERFVIAIPEVVTRQISVDGTRKYLVRIEGGQYTSPRKPVERCAFRRRWAAR